jgi:hypothetical protein
VPVEAGPATSSKPRLDACTTHVKALQMGGAREPRAASPDGHAAVANRHSRWEALQEKQDRLDERDRRASQRKQQEAAAQTEVGQ